MQRWRYAWTVRKSCLICKFYTSDIVCKQIVICGHIYVIHRFHIAFIAFSVHFFLLIFCFCFSFSWNPWVCFVVQIYVITLRNFVWPTSLHLVGVLARFVCMIFECIFNHRNASDKSSSEWMNLMTSWRSRTCWSRNNKIGSQTTNVYLTINDREMCICSWSKLAASTAVIIASMLHFLLWVIKLALSADLEFWCIWPWV